MNKTGKTVLISPISVYGQLRGAGFISQINAWAREQVLFVPLTEGEEWVLDDTGIMFTHHAIPKILKAHLKAQEKEK